MACTISIEFHSNVSRRCLPSVWAGLTSAAVPCARLTARAVSGYSMQLGRARATVRPSATPKRLLSAAARRRVPLLTSSNVIDRPVSASICRSHVQRQPCFRCQQQSARNERVEQKQNRTHAGDVLAKLVCVLQHELRQRDGVRNGSVVFIRIRPDELLRTGPSGHH